MENADALGILRQLERGEISAEQAGARLNERPSVESRSTPSTPEVGAPAWFRRLWFYPLLGGLLIVGLGTWIITATVHANILWFFCGLPILLLGTLVLAIAATAQSAHWLYVNIEGGRRRSRNFRIGFPFPLGLVRGVLWLGGLFIPISNAKFRVRGHVVKLGATWSDVEEFFTALEGELAQGRGITIDVDDADERVQVYIV
jgi:hypothetical protein